MAAGELILNGRRVLPESPPPDLTPYENRVLDFCRRWLGGQETFALRTSGSTGTPKEITLRRAQMVASARMTGDALGLQRGDRALVCLSAEYIAGLMMLVRGFVLGLRLTVVTPSANPLASLPPNARFDFTALVPLQLQTILAQTPDRLPILDGMKAILVGGAPVGLALQRQLQRIAAPVYHTYGMTETVSHIALRRLNGPRSDAAFAPLPGVRLGQDERGCLTVTAPVTGGRTLRTNDRVDLRPDGSFVWLGRLDNVINSGGVKVQVEKVERALERVLLDYRGGVFGGRRFFVGGTPDERLGEAVTMVMEGAPLPAQDEAAIRAALQTTLRRYEVPRRFAFLPRLSETPTGKIDRRASLRRLSLHPAKSEEESGGRIRN